MPSFASWGLVAAPLIALALYGVTWRSARRAEHALLTPSPAPLSAPLLVVVPARNEEARLGPTLEALLADGATGLRVLVYDDRSEDGTLGLARAYAATDPRLVVIDGSEDPPPARFGKPAALARALSHADRLELPGQERVLFLDADVVLAPGALGALVKELEHSGADALSGLLRLSLGSFAEALLVPAFVSLAARRFSPAQVHDAASPVAFLNGQLILVQRQALDKVGGFHAVHDAVLEDVALAARLKAAGARLRLADLRAVAATRMYAGLAELLEGFGKNAVPLQGGPAPTVAVSLLALATSLASPAAAVCAALALPAPPAMVALGLAALALLAQVALRRRLGVPGWPALLSPLSYAIVAFVYLRAAARVAFGLEVSWRGRRYLASRR